MSALQHCVGIPGGHTLEFSSEQLGEILSQIESELYLTQAYGRAISSLQAVPGDIGRGIQALVSLVAREAIGLTLRRLLKREAAIVNSDQTQASPNDTIASPFAASNLNSREETNSKDQPSVSSTVVSNSEMQMETAALSSATVSSEPVQRSSGQSLYPLPVPSAQPVRKPTKAELAAQAALQTWQQHVKQVGEELKQSRLAQNLSPYHLHLRTMVPVYQIESLESGKVDRLPEDVYIRGFIRQLGDALGLDGSALAKSLPSPHLPKANTVAPSWHRSKTKSGGFNLHPAHLYLGYTAAVASGFFWLSQQMPPQTTKPLVLDADESAGTSAEPIQHSGTTHQSSARMQTIDQGIAPPERVTEQSKTSL